MHRYTRAQKRHADQPIPDLTARTRATEDVISTDEAQKRRRERDRLRDEERRRAAETQLEREAYEANSLSRQKALEAMGMSRAKWYRLGKPSPQQNSETSPSPITNGEASAVALQAARCKAV
ncbi:hypothetical protein [Klebsiella quasipneumoniae]|uniref:hypothetical protein n=1 Tax=Klebsiella quasipneumoniae TaxID=1463165 RepID=UPI00388F5C30